LWANFSNVVRELAVTSGTFLGKTMSQIATATAAVSTVATFEERRRTADRIFRGALLFNIALTVFWLFSLLTHHRSVFFQQYQIDGTSLLRVIQGILIFNVFWGFIWYGVKAGLLKLAGFSKEELRQIFSSRMQQPFDVSAFVARHSERRIRIADMIGRRGRFLTLGFAVFFYMYSRQAGDPSPRFATFFLSDSLFEAVLIGWVFLAFYYSNGSLAALFYGPQSRIMDGVLARANCLLITTLWAMFRFIMVPLGAKLYAIFPPAAFAGVFAMIWGSYMAADGLSEVGGALFGKQKIKVPGIGDVNRKSIGGTVSGFVGSLVLCLWVVFGQHLPAPWIGLAIAISVSNSLLELFSPRGTDDFVMATANALICWGFGALVY
jgi:hypothetical protein